MIGGTQPHQCTYIFKCNRSHMCYSPSVQCTSSAKPRRGLERIHGLSILAVCYSYSAPGSRFIAFFPKGGVKKTIEKQSLPATSAWQAQLELRERQMESYSTNRRHQYSCLNLTCCSIRVLFCFVFRCDIQVCLA